jgi:hypothetical protein
MEVGHRTGEVGDALEMARERGGDRERAEIAAPPPTYLDAERHPRRIAPAGQADHRMRGQRQAISQCQPVEIGAQLLAGQIRPSYPSMKSKKRR